MWDCFYPNVIWLLTQRTVFAGTQLLKGKLFLGSKEKAASTLSFCVLSHSRASSEQEFLLRGLVGAFDFGMNICGPDSPSLTSPLGWSPWSPAWPWGTFGCGLFFEGRVLRSLGGRVRPGSFETLIDKLFRVKIFIIYNHQHCPKGFKMCVWPSSVNN